MSDRLREMLDSMLKSGRIPHALLFSGTGSVNLALFFAKEVICLSGRHHEKKVDTKNHPDVHVYHPEGKTCMHPIKNLKEITTQAFLSPFESAWKVFIIHEAEKMLPSSAHALLKTLEEPPQHTLFILQTRHKEKILPTICSRCQVFELPSEKNEHAPILDLLAGKTSILDFEKKYQDEITNNHEFPFIFFETVMLWFRDRLLLEMEEEGGGFLAFPDRSQDILKSPLQSLEKVEKAIRSSKLGLERSIKLSICIEYLFSQLFHS